MRRFINLEEANFNLNQREEILTKIADKIIWQSTQEEEYGLGEKSFLLQKMSNFRKWGHQELCNCIIVDNEAIEKEYGFENKVPDLTITINEDFIYITSDEKKCRIGKIVKNTTAETDVSKVVSIVKYIIVNGFENLYANKDYAELTAFSVEKSANKFYRKNIEFKRIADKILSDMIEYGIEVGLGLEMCNEDCKHGLGILDKKIVLSGSQRWNCAHKIEDSYVGIEYDEEDLKISFVNNHFRIKISSKHAYYEINTMDIAMKMVEIFKFHVVNGPIED